LTCVQSRPFSVLKCIFTVIRDEYEAQQQKAMARLSKSHNQSALATSIEEGMKAQSQQRKLAKPHTNNSSKVDAPDGNGTTAAAAEGGVVVPSVPGNAPGNNGVSTPQQGAATPAGTAPSEPTASSTGGGTGQQQIISAAVPNSSTNGGNAAAIAAIAAAAGQSSQLLPPPKSVGSRSDSGAGDGSSNTSGN
jgi:hypothetical protein